MQLMRRRRVEASLESTLDPERRLRRDLGAFDLAIMGIAVAVGSGIFAVGADQAAHSAGPAVILSFVIAAIVCALAMMCYAEFASSIPVAGSAYTFSYASLGEFVAWIIGWDLILEMLLAGSIVAKAWGFYLDDTLRGLGIGGSGTAHLGSLEVSWASMLLILSFTLLLVRGTKLSNRVNAIFTAVKLAIIVFIVAVGVFHVNTANYRPFVPPAQAAAPGRDSALHQTLFAWVTGAEPSAYGFLGVLAAAGVVFFAFLGFDVVATAAEETREPRRTLPRGILLGLGIVTALYLAVTAVVTGLVSYQELAQYESPTLATAFDIIGMHWASTIVGIGAVVGLTSVVLVLLLGTTRVIFALSRDGLLPRRVSRTSPRFGTPAGLQIGVGVVMALVAGFTGIHQLEEMVNIGTLSAFILVCFGIPVLRRRRPDLERSFRVPLSPVLPIAAGLACVWLTLQLTTVTWLRFGLWLAAGLVVYFCYSYRHSLLRSHPEQVAE